MVRSFFALLLLVHGLIHLMGFSKAFKYAELPQLQLPISRMAGAFWLIGALLFTAATVLFFLKKDSWWMIALPAIALSQILIFQNWQDAKFGSAANLIILVGSILAWGSWRFNQMIARESLAFLPPPETEAPHALTRNQLATLPLVVQHWLERTNTLGKPQPRLVELRQTGRMRTSPEGKWMPFEARQYIRSTEPGFFWTVTVDAGSGLQLVGRDKYEGGKGFMLIKALSLLPVANASGPETDQGALLRYLGEVLWQPGAALAPYLRWEPQSDSLAARATLRYGGVEASGVFQFSPEGDPRSFEALRYFQRKEGATLERWQVEFNPMGFRDFGDVRIPARSTVSWLLASGKFEWLELEIVDLRVVQ